MFKRRTVAPPQRINIRGAFEVRWWARHFGVSPEQLITAVKTVGPSPEAVARTLVHST